MKRPDRRTLANLELQNQAPRTADHEHALLAIDYGTKHCGLAFSPDGLVVLPLEIIPTENLFGRVRTVIAEKNIRQLVLGLPLEKDNADNELSRTIRTVGQKLEKLAPVTLVNERFSSRSVQNKRKGERIDDLAAAHILEFYLQSQ